MGNEIEETETPVNETEGEVVEEVTTDTEEVVEEEQPPVSKELQSALVQKQVYRDKLEAAEKKLAKAEAANANPDADTSGLDVEDYIDISASLDGLDARQKAFLAEQHKLSGKPLKDIREGEDFQLWSEAYTQRQEKENALKPNSTQEREDAPSSFTSKLQGASMAEKEALLKEQGLYAESPTSSNRVDIGNKVSTQ